MNKNKSLDCAELALGGFGLCCQIGKKASESSFFEEDAYRELYQAPETIQAGKRVALTPASEVWSFGATMFVLATGRYPFTSLEQICEANLVWPKATPMSHKFMTVISSMLQRDPELRPTLDEILRDPWFNSQEEQLSTDEINSAAQSTP